MCWPMPSIPCHPSFIARTWASGLSVFILNYVVTVAATRHLTQDGEYHPLNHRDMKIYVYTHPPHIPRWDHEGVFWEHRSMEEWVRKSKHYTDNGDEADYYWIPYCKCIHNLTAVTAVFDYIRHDFPWWNKTQSRHIMVAIHDNGPGEMFGRSTLNSLTVPPDINPRSPTRNVIFLHHNGFRDGLDFGKDECNVCFQSGKDIMLPTCQMVCGPLCGYNLTVLQAKSLWSPSRQHALRSGPRKYLLFYGGLIKSRTRDDEAGRGGLYELYRNHSDYLIVNSGPPENGKVDFSEAMQDAEFCYSPRGGSGGDTDRYMAALMFGCIPVMLSHGLHDEPMALPYEEVIPWRLFSTTIGVSRLADLDSQLRRLLPQVTEMRRHMGHYVKAMLFTSRYGSYFGETPDKDAMHTLMRILELRLRRVFHHAPEGMANSMY